jgi:hypothetical protein
VVAPCHAVIIQKKVVKDFEKIKVKTEKCVKVRKMYMKNNGTYFSLDKWIFLLQCTVLLYHYLKGMFNNYF